MPKESMTSQERWLAVLNRQKPDRIPMDYWGTPETTEQLCAHFGCDFDGVCERFHLDLPLTVGGQYVGPPLPDGEDVFGIRRQTVDYGTGAYDEVSNAPLAKFESVDAIEAGYTWPNPDHWDYSHLPDEVRGQEHRIVRGGGSEPFLVYKQLRGEEQAFVDLLMNPEIVRYCLGKLFDLAYENTRRIFETIPDVVKITYVAEDLGAQDTLMYSPEHIREFFLPGMKRMMDLTRENGAFVLTHTDGASRDILPDLIACGTQVLNPVQWVCAGMEREGLKRDFGDQLIFHGAMDNQHILPFGTVDDVRREVLDNYRILGAGGGYILCPCHNLQPVTPIENIAAMYQTGYYAGWQ